MRSPIVHTRMKQSHEFPGRLVDAGDVWPFVAVAMYAGERQILRDRTATMLYGNDMVHVHPRFVHVGDVAVFAAAVCPCPNLASQLRIHEALGLGRGTPRITRALDFIIVSKLPICR